MNSLSASHEPRGTESTFLGEREHWLKEYAQAVDFYQQTVVALNESDGTTTPGTLRSLLAQAEAARKALQQCRNRYYRSCTVSGATEQ